MVYHIITVQNPDQAPTSYHHLSFDQKHNLTFYSAESSIVQVKWVFIELVSIGYLILASISTLVLAKIFMT